MYADVWSRRRGHGSDDLRSALTLIAWVASLAVGLEISAFAVVSSGRLFGLLTLYALIGLATVIVGLVLWDIRPGNRIGALVCVMGFATMLAAAANGPSRGMYLVGFIAAEAPIAALAHLMLAFPSGRLRGRLEIALVAAAYVITVGLQIPQYVFSPDPAVFDGLRLAARSGWVSGADRMQSVAGSVALVVAAAAMAARFRRARRGSWDRRRLGFVYVYGTGTILFLPFSANVLRPALHLSALSLFQIQIVALLGVPFVFAIAVHRGGFARMGRLETLASWAIADADQRPTALSEALADVLGDPTVEVWRAHGADGFIDETGARRMWPDPDNTERGLVNIDGSGERLGAICYDTHMIADSEIVRRAGRIVVINFERERLTSELIASRQAVLASRARLVELADEQRRSFAHDLHDVLQNRLVIAALHAGRLAVQDPDGGDAADAARQLRGELDEAIDELRRLSHGVMPAPLIERGLFAAAEDLLDRLPVPTRLDIVDDGRPLAARVASTGYFVLAEAVSNSVKHAGASMMDVSLKRVDDVLHLEIRDDGVGGANSAGTGLSGMADRIDALDGRLLVSSPAGQGTSIKVRLPCAP